MLNFLKESINNGLSLLKVPIDKIGFTPVLAVFLVYKWNIRWLIILYIAIFLQKYLHINMSIGLIGEMVISNNYLFIFTCMITVIFLYSTVKFMSRFGFAIDKNELINTDSNQSLMNGIDIKQLKIFLGIMNIKNILINRSKGQFFDTFKYQMYHPYYPISYLIYDIRSYFKMKSIFVTIQKNNKGKGITIVNIIIFKNFLFKKRFYEAEMYLSMFFRPYLFLKYFTNRANYFHFGINMYCNFFRVPLSSIYNLFIIDTFDQLSWEYISNYLVANILNNKNNIIYILRNTLAVDNGQNKMIAHYKYLTEQLEKATLQSRLKKKNKVVMFLYHQLFPLMDMLIEYDKYARQINYLRGLITSSIGHYHIIIIENNNQIIQDFFYPESGIYIGDREKYVGILISGTKKMSESKKLVNCYGLESTQTMHVWLFKQEDKQVMCSLPIAS